MTIPQQRPLCPQCRLPTARCFCDLVVKIHTPVPLIVWQHPSEQKHPKATLPLLSACLESCQVLVSEQLSRAEFDSLTHAQDRPTWLLFPDNPSTAPVVADNAPPENGRLLLLDGTWRKARKLLYLNPWLQELPRWSLPEGLVSDYRIRKAEKPGQLSTFEAACAALEQLEESGENSRRLRHCFDQYMARLSRHQ